MRKLCLWLALALAPFAASAQTVPTPPAVALVCANNTVVPSPTSGKFFYVQCDSSGKLLTSGGGGGGGTLTAGTTATSGFTAGQYLYSDGSKLQAGSFGTGVATALGLALNGSGAVSATTSPVFVTPTLGIATGTSLTLGGAALGGNALAVAGSTALGITTVTNLSSSSNATLGNGSLFVQAASGNVSIASVAVYGIVSGSSVPGTIDTAFSRDSAGVIDVGTGAQGSTAGSMKMTNLDASGPVRASHGYTVATLPAAGTAGRRAYVTDQLTTCAGVGVAPTGGGAVTCPVFDNGTSWVGG